MPYVMHVTAHDVAIAAGVGLIAAGVGILLMRGVGACEALFGRLRVRAAYRPVIGGAFVGLLALATPQVLSSGHGALPLALPLDQRMWAILMLFVLKSLASIVSLGSGFRGGLFFASLLLGALGGRVLAESIAWAVPALAPDPHIYAIIGMGALSVSVIGGPLT